MSERHATPATDDERVVAQLLARHMVDAADLARAQDLAGRGSERLSAVLVRLGLVADRDIAAVQAEILGLTLATAADYPDAPVLPDRLGERFLRHAGVLPLRLEAGRLLLAMVDPLDAFSRRAVEVASGLPTDPRIAVMAELEEALSRLYAEAPDGRGSATAEHLDDDIARLRDLASEAPVIRLANAILDRAAAAGASDVHIEPMANRLSLRFRLDGELREQDPPPRGLHAALVSRLKLMAGLDIAERRLPQDGRIRRAHAGREMDLRVATTPSLHGEAMVIRLLNREEVPLDLARIGLSAPPLAALRALLARPNGMILVTGPTGSGKTTTLYAALASLNRPGRKLVSIEDPIEYRLDGVTQIQVQPSIGLDFARVLRSVLRHDPDIALIGEVRDRETAEIAMQAALTGHLVLSTLHTNGAAATIGRLLEMGVADHLMAATLRGVLAQRLVRRLCLACRVPAPETAWPAGYTPSDDATPHAPSGCAACFGTGYRGRIMLAEALPVSPTIRRLILAHAEAGAIAAAGVAEGWPRMLVDGLDKVGRGETSLAEVLQATSDD